TSKSIAWATRHPYKLGFSARTAFPSGKRAGRMQPGRCIGIAPCCAVFADIVLQQLALCALTAANLPRVFGLDRLHARWRLLLARLRLRLYLRSGCARLWLRFGCGIS